MAFLTAQKRQGMIQTKKRIIAFCVIATLSSCATKNITKYYYQNKSVLDSIEQSYKDQYKHKHFTLEFMDKLFDHVSLEIWTDSIKYIYEFGTTEMRLKDTLVKYDLMVDGVNKLIRQMQSIHCTWVNNLDYYVANTRHSMIFMSIRPKAINFLTRKKYYILTYFPVTQYYDKEGRLMVARRLRKVQKINADIFHRITDNVAYTLSDRFR